MRISRYINLKRPVGEVAGISGTNITVYLYPEAYEEVSMGDLLVVVSKLRNYVGVVVKNLHRVRRERSFSLMGMDYEEIKKLYPDIDRLYVYALEVSLIGFSVDEGSFNLGLGGAPRIHDPVYKLDSDDVVEVFKAGDDVSFSVFRYLADYLSDDVWVREFFSRNASVLTRLGGMEYLLERLMDSLVWVGVPSKVFGRVVSTFIEEVLGNG